LILANVTTAIPFQLVLLEANRFATASLEDVLEVFSYVAEKYRKEYKRVPVLIIDNANRLAEMHQRLLDLIQDYAKRAADEGTATVVFVSSKGRIPSRMMGKLYVKSYSFVNYYMLIKCL
jgi:hypothetical protein